MCVCVCGSLVVVVAVMCMCSVICLDDAKQICDMFFGCLKDAEFVTKRRSSANPRKELPDIHFDHLKHIP
jgi:hypothetical protein